MSAMRVSLIPPSLWACDFITSPLPEAHSSAASPAFGSAASKSVPILTSIQSPPSRARDQPLPRELSPKSSDGCLQTRSERSSQTVPWKLPQLPLFYYSFPLSSSDLVSPSKVILLSDHSTLFVPGTLCFLCLVAGYKPGSLLPRSPLPLST